VPVAVPRERRSNLPQDIARCILAGFDKHYRLFRDAARRAKTLFEEGNWREMRALASERIQMYDRRVQEAVDELNHHFAQAAHDESLWPAIKIAYIGLLHEHHQPECAETFYNSVACAVLHRRHYHNEFIFWRPAIATEHLEGDQPTYACYYPLVDGLRQTLRNVAQSFDLKNRWENPRSARTMLRKSRRGFSQRFFRSKLCATLRSVCRRPSTSG